MLVSEFWFGQAQKPEEDLCNFKRECRLRIDWLFGWAGWPDSWPPLQRNSASSSAAPGVCMTSMPPATWSRLLQRSRWWHPSRAGPPT